MNILFFHGFDSHPDSLQRSIDCLTKAGHQVTAPFMTSFSLNNGKHSAPQQWFEDAQSLLNTFVTTTRGDIAIAGHSLGGAICAHLLGQINPETDRNDLTRRISKCAFLASPAGVDDRFLAYWRETSSEQIDWPFSLQVQMFSFLQRCDAKYMNVSIPSLVLQGDSDVHIPPSSGIALAEKLGIHCHSIHTHSEADHFFPNNSSSGARYLQEKLVAFFANNG
ncbi:alpha/beta hydrolase [Desulfosediminicola flagellatus]|uniref:alpha/beta hydrolase n=1 Tax=Desulfosediminicola flagellatus TaxID=2569541 RepID=UPI0010ABAB80|nr:alpha/beta fold hydrolase [Desulfosediminicola flagellatus]